MNKRLITAMAAVSASATVLATTSAAEVQYNVDSASMLLNTKPSEADQDVGAGDDRSDLIIIGDNNTDNNVVTTRKFPATEDNTRYIGRNFYDGDTLWLVQSGSAAEFNVCGTSASVVLCGDEYMHSEPDMRPRYAILVDGEVVRDSFVSHEPERVTVFSGTEPRSATVRIIHLSEANYGAIGVSGIEADTYSDDAVSPTNKKDVSIEFIGDSITCGYGVEAASQYEPFTTATENFMKSYAYLAAEKLSADYSAVSYSGHGIYSGYSPDGSRMEKSLVPPYYSNIGSLPAYARAWDFSSAVCDIVVLSLGTNDGTYIVNDPRTRSEEFSKAYRDFLGVVRQKNPDAYIVCTHGAMGYPDVYSVIAKTVVDYTAETGDNRITSFQLPEQKYSNGYGADWHPSSKTQMIAAEKLAEELKTIIGKIK